MSQLDALAREHKCLAIRLEAPSNGGTYTLVAGPEGGEWLGTAVYENRQAGETWKDHAAAPNLDAMLEAIRKVESADWKAIATYRHPLAKVPGEKKPGERRGSRAYFRIKGEGNTIRAALLTVLHAVTAEQAAMLGFPPQ